MGNVPVTYLGVAICTDAEILEADASGARVSTREPMPVGTELEIEIEGTTRRARVIGVKEIREAEMNLRFVQEEEIKPKRKRKKTS